MAAPAGLLPEAADEGDQQEHAHQADRRRAAEAPEVGRGGERFTGGELPSRAIVRKAAGLAATSHQRALTCQRPMRASNSRTPGRPVVHAVTANAAISGPSSAG